MASIWKRPLDFMLVVIFINFALIAATIGMVTEFSRNHPRLMYVRGEVYVS